MSDKQYSLPLRPPTDRPVQMLAPHEAFTRADSALIDRLIEDSVVEKKNGRIKPSPLAEYFSMWANTSPAGGLIIVGVENDGTITGLNSLSNPLLSG
jgi:ATP-dependent DNA helicase RecG